MNGEGTCEGGLRTEIVCAVRCGNVEVGSHGLILAAACCLASCEVEVRVEECHVAKGTWSLESTSTY